MSPILPGIVASGISGHLFTPEGSAYEIASYTVPSATTVQAVTFAIPSGYRHIRIQGTAMMNSAVNPTWRVNNDSDTTKYAGHHMWSTGSSMAANNQSGMVFWGYNPSTSYPSSVIMDWLDYGSTTKNKTMRALSGSNTNGGTQEIAMWSGLYMSTNPITSITLDGINGQFTANSSFTLIGYK